MVVVEYCLFVASLRGCSIIECKSEHYGLGLCHRHYNQKRNGSDFTLRICTWLGCVVELKGRGRKRRCANHTLCVLEGCTRQRDWPGPKKLLVFMGVSLKRRDVLRLVFDFAESHKYVSSTTADHAHLYIDHEISYTKWVILMLALRLAGVCEKGFVDWSLRRGANFVRIEGTQKQEHEYSKIPEEPPTFS